jgi:hypothetical protein
MSSQAGQQDESLLSRLFNSPLGKMAMTAIVAYLARRMLGGQQTSGAGQGQQPGGLPGGLDIGAILGALGAAQGQEQGREAGGAPVVGQPDLSGLLSGKGDNSDLGKILTSLGGAQGQRDDPDDKQR